MSDSIRSKLCHKILDFDQNRVDLALELFEYQFNNNIIYNRFCKELGRKPGNVASTQGIPFLPISFFKTHEVRSGGWNEQIVFQSSGTTGQQTSKHLLREEAWYQQVSRSIFERCYGPLSDYNILALLPSYLERNNSSLVYMCKHFMELSGSPLNGFFLNDFDALREQLRLATKSKRKTILIGVSFALLDFGALESGLVKDLIVIETGGMKGRKKEITRSELHTQLASAFGIEKIHSEYGMTELLSQAWSTGDGIFETNPALDVLIREVNDPFSYLPAGSTGAINIIDYANVDTCCFIATDDLGRKKVDGRFEVLGRLDNSDLRGCNLMAGMEV